MKHKGFTLIELLVVVAIIGILATVIITSLSQARSKARDARRLQDIKQIQTALEVYYLENGQYPSSTGLGGPGLGATNNNVANSAAASWEALETMMGVTLPRDPVNQTGGGPGYPEKYLNYAYYSSTTATLNCPTGTWYVLAYRLEKGDATGDDRIGVTRCDTEEKYYVQNGAITTGISPMM